MTQSFTNKFQSSDHCNIMGNKCSLVLAGIADVTCSVFNDSERMAYRFSDVTRLVWFLLSGAVYTTERRENPQAPSSVLVFLLR